MGWGLGNLLFKSSVLFQKDGGHYSEKRELASKLVGALNSRKIRYVGERGNTYNGDAALDDPNFASCDVSTVHVT